MSTDSRIHDAAPFIARIAGLPASAISGLGSAELVDAVREWRAALDRAGILRAELVDELHRAIHGAPRERRRFLLAVKRCCYNGRPIAKYLDHPLWPTLEEAAGEVAQRLLELERRLKTDEARIDEIYRETLSRQREDLLELYQDESFLRGVALGSPVLIESLSRSKRFLERENRKTRKLEASLLRFASRAALKLSPYSTLTRLGVGKLRRGAKSRAPELLGGPWQHRSLLRLKPYIFNQLHQALLRHLPYRDDLAVKVNDTVEEVAPDRFRFLRFGHWSYEPSTRSFKYTQDAIVKVDLKGPLISWLRAELAEERLFRDALEGAAEAVADGEVTDQLNAVVTKLLDIGFLQCAKPWSVNERSSDKKLAAYLRTLPHCEGLDAVIAGLDRIVDLREGYAVASQPARSVSALRHEIEKVWDAVGSLVDLDLDRDKLTIAGSYEDVMVTSPPTTHRRGREVMALSTSSVDGIFGVLEPIFQYSYLFNLKHELCLAVNEIAEQRWPGRDEHDVIELFDAIRPFWQDFQKFEVEWHKASGWKKTFNPLRLEAVNELASLRDAVREDLRQCLYRRGDHWELSPAALERLVAAIPRRFRSPIGPCAFVQPATADADHWVLNRMFEGTGRYSSRYTCVMDERTRERYTAHFKTQGRNIAYGDLEVDLLDIMCGYGDTLNVHAAQTATVLEFDNGLRDLPATCRRKLGDLRIRLRDLPNGPVLRDRSGARYLPVHLGAMNLKYMPPVYRFLALLGLGDMRLILPQRPSRNEDDVSVLDRTVAGNVILERKRWFIPHEPFVSRITKMAETDAFRAIASWRSEVGLPEKVFMIEKVNFENISDVYKPQYIDFESPVFVRLFLSILKSHDDLLVFDEALPMPEEHVADASGQRWAVELQLEALGISQSISSAATEPTDPPAVALATAVGA